MGFGGLGIGETLLILLVALLIFGPRRLPEIGSSLGKGIREFKRSINEVKHEISAAGDPVAPRIGGDSRAPVLKAPELAVATEAVATEATTTLPRAAAAPPDPLAMQAAAEAEAIPDEPRPEA